MARVSPLFDLVFYINLELAGALSTENVNWGKATTCSCFSPSLLTDHFHRQVCYAFPYNKLTLAYILMVRFINRI